MSVSFPGATNETLLNKFHTQHQNNEYYEVPQMRENAFSIVHYAGRVKYQIAVSMTMSMMFVSLLCVHEIQPWQTPMIIMMMMMMMFVCPSTLGIR